MNTAPLACLLTITLMAGGSAAAGVDTEGGCTGRRHSRA